MWNHPHARRDRARIAGATLVFALGLLGVSFFRVQVLASSDYALTARNNRLRQIELPAPRGTIFDRNGRVVVDNVPGYAVTILPGPRDTIAATLDRLAPILGLTPRRVEELRSRIAGNRHLVVDADVAFERVSRLEERRPDFPGVHIETRPRRRYFGGAAVGHIVGYLGEISREQLSDSLFPGYRQGMVIGQGGLEREYEVELQGETGYRLVEVDALRRIVGDFAGQEGLAARPGEDLHLSLDLGLQEFIHEIFPAGKTGAVVALDPADGSVLALYSAPSYDPNLFLGDQRNAAFAALIEDEARPLFNRAIQGTFAPASTWKLATAAMAIDLGLIDADTHMEEPCRGGMMFGNSWKACHKVDGHGDVDLTGAIAGSCNVYFYQVGMKIGLTRYLELANELGFNTPCGIDLPGERASVFPQGPEYWERVFGYTPRDGETLNLAIGQGPNSQTPLKMAQFYVALARDGSAPVPRLVPDPPGDRTATPGEAWRLEISEGALHAIRDGMRAVTSPGGTAWLSSLELWDLIGKSGSGQNPRGLTDAWFAGMAGPHGEDPEIVIIALVEDVPEGQGGSSISGPIVAKAADYYLRSKRGIEVPEVQTLREHIQTGPWPAWAARPPPN
ncbi:MAG: penicillin-binding protein 2 [Longimicrobiales bacterium]|nr:penicillin-binding protein 2 [Longimicrobiales bacterium]